MYTIQYDTIRYNINKILHNLPSVFPDYAASSATLF